MNFHIFVQHKTTRLCYIVQHEDEYTNTYHLLRVWFKRPHRSVSGRRGGWEFKIYPRCWQRKFPIVVTNELIEVDNIDEYEIFAVADLEAMKIDLKVVPYRPDWTIYPVSAMPYFNWEDLELCTILKPGRRGRKFKWELNNSNPLQDAK